MGLSRTEYWSIYDEIVALGASHNIEVGHALQRKLIHHPLFRETDSDLFGYQHWLPVSTLLGRLSWLHSWVWRQIRLHHLETLKGPAKDLGAVSTRLELEVWGVETGVCGWLDIVMEAQNPYWSSDIEHANWTHADVMVPSPLWAAYSPSAAIQEEARVRLRRRAEAAAIGVSQEQARIARRGEPPEGLDDALAALNRARGELRLLNAPRALEHLGTVQVGNGEDLFDYQEDVSCACGDLGPAGVQVIREASGEFVIRCQCRWDSDKPCGVKLSAVDVMLDVLHDPTSEVGLDLAKSLRLPAWSRSVQALVGQLRSPASKLAAGDFDFGWEVAFSKGDIQLYPITLRPKKRSPGFTAQRFPFSEWEELGYGLSGVDGLALRELALSRRASRFNASEIVVEIIAELAGSSRVYYRDKGIRPLTVRASLATPEVDVVDGDLVIKANFGGEISDTLLEHALSLPSCWVYSGIEDGVLELFKISETIADAIYEVASAGLPSEAQDAVLDASADLLEGGQLMLSQKTRGEQRAPVTAVSLDLEVHEARLCVRVRAMPISTRTTFPIEGGPSVVYGACGNQRFWAQRDRVAERELAEEVGTILGIEFDDNFEWVVALSDEALEVVSALDILDDREDIVVRWRSQAVAQVGTISASNISLHIGGLRGWLSLSGTAVVAPGVESDIAQLLFAAREGRSWVEVKGGWAKVEGALRRALEGLGDDVSMFAAPLLCDLEAQGATLIGDESWRDLNDKMSEAIGLEPAVPVGLNATLRPYQLEGFTWLCRLAHWAPGAVLADDMGLGKTIQALALALHRVDEGPILVVGPTSLGFNWQREAERFAPSLEIILIRSGADLDQLKDIGSQTLVFVSYGLLARYGEELNLSWGTLFFDEAQALKNPATRRAQAAQGLDAKFTVALTGTPVENRTAELWSLFHVVVPSLLGSHASFRSRFVIPIERHQDSSSARALASLVAPFVLRRLKREVARELPSRTNVRLDVELSSVERRLYDAFRQELLKGLDGEEDVERFQVLAAIMRLRQLACHPGLVDSSYVGESAKISILNAKLGELVSEGERALVFSQFTSLLDLVQPILHDRGYRVLRLDGSTSSKKRGQLVDAFQRGDADVFLLSTKAGGVGLNLTAASAVFHLDPWWNPAVEDQATDRAHRIGQLNPVTVYRLVSKGTIEEPIYEIHHKKRELVDSLLSGSGSSRALTPEELRQLIESDGYQQAERDPLSADDGVTLLSRDEPLNEEGECDETPLSPGDEDVEVVDPYQDVLAFMQSAVEDGSLADGSARTYRPKLRRFINWAVGASQPLTAESVEMLLDEYAAKLATGEVEAPASDQKYVRTIGRWVIRSMTGNM